ncbi:MAG: hypothetical protein KA362_06715 [Chloroflexi bacterium]|nr:hypothetical protein [Chloroflexota bacterium]
MNHLKRSVLLAWLLCLFCVLVASATLVHWLLSQNGLFTLAGLVEAVGWNWALPVLFSTLAALIIAYQPRNRVGWLLMLPALVTALPNLYSLAAPPLRLTLGVFLLIWFDGWSWIPIIFAIFLIPLHFPTGRPPSPKWNWVNWLAVGMWLFFITVTLFVAPYSPPNYDWTLPNPIGFIPISWFDGPFMIIWGAGLLTVVSGSVVSLFSRYRHAHMVERQQIKWLLYVGAVFILVYAAVFLFSDTQESNSMDGWVNLIFTLSILAFPVAIAIAILRYQLFDINVIIRKTAVYTVLTAVLALVYFGTIILLQSLVGQATGEQSPLIIVFSTLVIAALFAPLRQRIQAIIDRRFFRKKYDAQQVLAQFAQTARDETDMAALQAELLRVVQETMQPEQLSVWLNSKQRTK